MKVSFVIFDNDISDDQKLYEINNTEIKFGVKKVVTRKTVDIDDRVFLSLVLSNRVFWKYRMYDMNNRKRNVWLIREKDYKEVIK